MFRRRNGAAIGWLRVTVGVLAGWALLSGRDVAAQDCGPEWRPAFEVDPGLYPFTHRCAELSHGIIHYIDEGPTQSPAGVVLMLHGNPTWSFLYRDVAIELATDGYRVIAPDMYGFGLSDKPDPATFTYSPRSQAEAILEFVQHLDLRGVTLVVQDWGGPMGFQVAGREPWRFRSVVVLNTWAWPMTEELRPYFHHSIDWAASNVALAKFYLRTGIVPRTAGQSMALLHGQPGTPEYEAVKDAYWAPFLNLDTGEPTSIDVMQPTNRLYHFFEVDPQFMEEAESGVAAMADRPMRMVFGGRDAWFGALRCDETRLPHCPEGTVCGRRHGLDVCLDEATTDPIYPSIDQFTGRWSPDRIRGVEISETAGHFVQETKAEAIADAVREVARRPVTHRP